KAGTEGGATEIYRVNADGNVVMSDPTRTVVGDQAVYDVDQQVVIVTGKNLKLTTATDWVTARDSLEWYDQKQIAVARGDALAARDTRRLRADVIVTYFTKDKAKGGTPQGMAPGKTAAGKPGTAANANKDAAKPGMPNPSAPNGEESRI